MTHAPAATKPRNMNAVLPREVVMDLRHDLRNPLNHIAGYAEFAGEIAADEGLSDRIQPLLDALGRSAHSALQLVLTWLPDGQAVTVFHLAVLRDRMQGLQYRLAREMQRLRAAVGDCGCASLEPELERLQRATSNFAGFIERIPGYVLRSQQDQNAVAAPVKRDPSEDGAHLEQTPAVGRSALLVDDQEDNREILARYLSREGFDVVQASNGGEALDLLRQMELPPDIVLLDIRMPGRDGISVLREMKTSGELMNIPVVMTSALDDLETVVQCIELGAEDYLPKPFNPVLVRTRLSILQERKRLRDAERLQSMQLQSALEEAREQKRVAESLLLNILPAPVAEELQQRGLVDPSYHADVTIVFTDFVGFSKSTEQLAAEELVAVLHEYFTAFDLIIERYRLEKLKTIGDSYMFVSGLPVLSPSHPVDAVLAALEMVEAVRQRAGSGGPVEWKVRIGIHTGPVIAGVVGLHKFAFDVWGDAVNFASRVEQTCEPDGVNLSDKAHARVKDFFRCERRDNVPTKDQLMITTYQVRGILPALHGAEGEVPPEPFKRRYKVYFRKEPSAFPAHIVNARQETESL